MKTVTKGLGLLLILVAQVFAQKFIAAKPDVFRTGLFEGHQNYGYIPRGQSAALGEKKSSYSNLMLFSGRDTVTAISGNKLISSYKVVNSYGKDLGDIYPISLSSKPYSFKNSAGETVYDNKIGAVVVLDSLSDNKRTAIVLFATFKRLIVTEIRINYYNMVEYSVLATIEMQEPASQADGIYDSFISRAYRRLTFLGTGLEGNDKVYHIATGNPLYKSGTNLKSGRVDFFSIRENLWTVTQPNTKGIASGEGFLFMQNTAFGSDLVSVGDLDGNGYNELAVLAPSSDQFLNGAVYIFFMDNEYTPSSKSPSILTGTSMPWKENTFGTHKQDCTGMSFVRWENEPHLLISCNMQYNENNSSNFVVFVKDIVLGSGGNVVNTNIFSAEKRNYGGKVTFKASSNPVPVKNHKNGNFAVVMPIESCSLCSGGYVYVYQVMDIDASKNFSVEIGKQETITDLDSLFYKSGTTGYLSKTLAGQMECHIKNTTELVCETGEEAHGSWSMVELSSKSACNPYRTCKRKDTVYVYARANSEPANTALRIPKNIVIAAQSEIFTIEKMNSLAYFRNPEDLNTALSWNQDKLKFSVTFSNTDNQLSIIPIPQREGIDTIVFNLSISANTNSYPVRLHITDASKILENSIPATPGEDTVWNISQKKYIALPRSSSNGNIYTYDIAQDNLGNYAEIAGDYLHILKVDVADIFIAYTENSQIKYRKITLMPEAQTQPQPLLDPNPIAGGQFAQNLKAAYFNGGLQIDGLNGEFEIKSYNFKGVEIQRERANTIGSAFVKLKQNCPQVVQIKSGNQKIYMKVVN